MTGRETTTARSPSPHHRPPRPQIIGVILYAASSSGLMLDLSFNEAMAYASILSATDAVAVANIYRALDADPMLTVMIYGEGSVNDAASIVMYQVGVRQWE